METTKQIVSIIVQGSMFLTIMAISMRADWRQVVARIRRPQLLVRAVIAVNVVVPLAAVLCVSLLPLTHPVAVGLILMAVSPLAPLMPGSALKTGADRAYVLALYVLLILIAVVIVPLTVSILNDVFHTHAQAPARTVARVVLVSGLLPIGLGLLMNGLAPAFTARAARPIALIANITLALFVLLLLVAAHREFLSMIGDGTIVAFGLTVLAGIAAGHLLGGRDPVNRGALALAAAVRHPGIAAAIGHASGANSHAMAATILFLLNGVVVSSLYQLWLKRQNPSPAVAA